jgi:predicted XRE-type DNA-binding protein
MRIDMAKPNEQRKERIVKSSGNVFADLGFADADERHTKVRLAAAINEVLQRRGLTQGKAAEQLGINQPKISALSKYRLEGFSVERLMRFLTSLNQDVEIVIRNKPRTRRTGRVFVTPSRPRGNYARQLLT